MIVWGCVAGYLTERAGHLVPGLDANMVDGDLAILTKANSIAVGYNRILDLAPAGSTVVLLHDDTDLGDGARTAISSASADVTGVVGGTGLDSMAWWNARSKSGRVDQAKGPLDLGPHGPVDAVDGLLMVLSPSATGLRFDEDYPGFHGYDVDFCFQARAEGLTVATADIPVTHQTRGGIKVKAEWNACEAVWRSKWFA